MARSYLLVVCWYIDTAFSRESLNGPAQDIIYITSSSSGGLKLDN
jgi:hypothetical protein